MLNLISSFARDDSGAAAVEYGLLVALIAAVIVGTVSILGTQVKTGFVTVCTALGGTC
jgi:pilus assembly protein Flp/PilA